LPEDFNIEDIAHALSNICRYGGHTRVFYSVAQHCVLCSLHVEPECAREALFHDASEAFMGDMVRPLKDCVPEFKRIEERTEFAIATRFGLRYPWPAAVKEVDDRMLFTERRDLIVHQPDWGWFVQPYPFVVQPVAAHEAKAMFFDRARELGFEF
jgi:5'-deoxynucleotidase YfbR-like HD superfamily hydrolase